jgi:pyruvate kinase
MEAERTEYRYNRDEDIKPTPKSATYISDAVCLTACRLAHSTDSDALIGMTQTGYTGFVLSSYRPKSNLFVFTKERSLVNQLSLSWGVRAFFYDEEAGYDQIIADQIQILKERGFIKKGQVVVHTGSTPVELHLPTNTIKVTVVE